MQIKKSKKGFVLLYAIGILALIAIAFGVIAGIMRSVHSSSSAEYFYASQDNITVSSQAWVDLHRQELNEITAEKTISIPLEEMGIRKSKANIIIKPIENSEPQITLNAQLQMGRQQRSFTLDLSADKDD